MDKIVKDFSLYAKDRGISSLKLHHYTNAIQAGYMNPTVLEERQLNVTPIDVFSRMMMDRIIFFGTSVNSDSCNIVMSQLLYLNSVDDSDISMYINSPGGSVYDGLSIIDTMNYIDCDVSTVGAGMAASMGAILLASGEKGKRYALPHTRIMIHQPMGGTEGQASDIEIMAKEILKVKDELYTILSNCTGQDIERIVKDADRDCWMLANEAKEYGIIDQLLIR